MNDLFHYDSPAASVLVRIGEWIVLNLFWLVCSLPIVTMGAATTALYRVSLNSVQKKGAPLSDFWRYLRAEFRQATCIWLIALCMGTALIFDWYFLLHIEASLFRSICFVLTLPATVVYLFVLTFAFPLQAGFSNSVLNTLKNAFLLSFSNPLATAALAAFSALPLLLVLWMDAGLLLLAVDVAPTAAVSAFVFHRIFQNYLPTADPA